MKNCLKDVVVGLSVVVLISGCENNRKKKNRESSIPGRNITNPIPSTEESKNLQNKESDNILTSFKKIRSIEGKNGLLNLEKDQVGELRLKGSPNDASNHLEIVRAFCDQTYQGKVLFEGQGDQVKLSWQDSNCSRDDGGRSCEYRAIFSGVENSSGPRSIQCLKKVKVSLKKCMNLASNSALGDQYIPEWVDLPILRIETENQAKIISKETELLAEAKLIMPLNDCEEKNLGSLEIKGRGNSTWVFDKKPYKLKFKKEVSILSIPEETEWVLLANYADKTMLRNKSSFELGRRLELAFTPRSEEVELFMNGEYYGVYQLAESIKSGVNRVNIAPIKAVDSNTDANISGDYLLEIDARLDGDFNFTTSELKTPIVFKEPKKPSKKSLNWIENYVEEFEKAIHSNQSYDQFIDEKSFVDYYLITELVKNPDTYRYSSTYFYKKRDDKIYMGPLWDFDIALGNDVFANGSESSEGFWAKNHGWMPHLMNNPKFVAKVKERWKELKEREFEAMISYMEEKAEDLDVGSTNNFRRWPVLGKKVEPWVNLKIYNSYPEESDALKLWYKARLDWLDNNINKLK